MLYLIYAGNMSAVFTDGGELNVAYTEAEIIMEALQGEDGKLVETKTISDKVEVSTDNNS